MLHFEERLDKKRSGGSNNDNNKNNNNCGLGKSAEEFKNRKEKEVHEFEQKPIKVMENLFFFDCERQFAKAEDSIKYIPVVSRKRKAQPTSNSQKAEDEMDKKGN